MHSINVDTTANFSKYDAASDGQLVPKLDVDKSKDLAPITADIAETDDMDTDDMDTDALGADAVDTNPLDAGAECRKQRVVAEIQHRRCSRVVIDLRCRADDLPVDLRSDGDVKEVGTFRAGELAAAGREDAAGQLRSATRQQMMGERLKRRSASADAGASYQPPHDSGGDEAEADVATDQDEMEVGDPGAGLVAQ